MRQLVIMRHAQAEAAASSDHARSLTSRGRAAAADCGRWISERMDQPSYVLASDALRTTQTWQRLAQAADWSVEADFSAALYVADCDTILDLLRDVPSDVDRVFVVGHNPALAFLADLIDDGAGEEEATNALVTSGYPPATLTLFEVSVDWAELGNATASVAGFHLGVS